jgi:hypothetical protein
MFQTKAAIPTPGWLPHACASASGSSTTGSHWKRSRIARGLPKLK